MVWGWIKNTVIAIFLIVVVIIVGKVIIGVKNNKPSQQSSSNPPSFNLENEEERKKAWKGWSFDKIPEFQKDPDLLEKKWVKENVFVYGEVKRWLEIGIKPKEYDFVRWIINVKSKKYNETIQAQWRTPNWINDNVNLGDLRREYLESKNNN